MTDPRPDEAPVDRYLELGLRLGRHIDGFVDAYYGPPALAARVEREPVGAPAGPVSYTHLTLPTKRIV